jgi:hypothetical protein
MSPNANYIAGRKFEYDRCKYWREVMGYKTCRTAGSHGEADVIATHDDRGVILIQCKLVSTEAEKDAWIRKFKAGTRPIKGAQKRMEVKIRGSNEVYTWSI